MSLAVSDMTASRDFYAKLEFEMVAGDGETWTIIANEGCVLGLFQGMFESNILTFNPGWVGVGETVGEFTDIRVLRADLVGSGIEVNDDTTGESAKGPASFTLIDPDGNAILIDQHV